MSLVAGIRPVEVLLRETPKRIKTLYFIPKKKPSPKIETLLQMAQSLGIPVAAKSPEAAPASRTPHQGIWADILPFDYTPFSSWLAHIASQPFATLLILDGITDPHNLGAILRSAACLNCQGVLIPKNRSARVTPTVWKVSSGGAGTVPVLRETNLVRCTKRLKKEGFWIFGTQAAGGFPLWETPWAQKSAIVLGNEERGIHPLLHAQCDMTLSIPLTGPVTSLNVSVAAGMILYERMRARKAHPGEGEKT